MKQDSLIVERNINDALQFIGTEEGRARVKDSTLIVYDYFLKDHLGNIRMVLTDEQQTDAYPAASMETDQLGTEKMFYSGGGHREGADQHGE